MHPPDLITRDSRRIATRCDGRVHRDRADGVLTQMLGDFEQMPWPQTELFQVDEDTIHRNALMIMQLDERPRIRVLVRRDREHGA